MRYVHLARSHLTGTASPLDLLGRVHKHGWVVYAKEPLGGPEQVLDYLGRYVTRSYGGVGGGSREASSYPE